MNNEIVNLVNFYKAHLSEHATQAENYETCLKAFLQRITSIPRNVNLTYKSIYDRFNKLVADRRKNVKEQDKASGISVVNSDMDDTIDVMICAIDEKAEKKRTEQQLLKQ